MASFRLEFTNEPNCGIVHAYDLEAGGAAEAHGSARGDFNRVQVIYGATDFRVFDTRTATYYGRNHQTFPD